MHIIIHHYTVIQQALSSTATVYSDSSAQIRGMGEVKEGKKNMDTQEISIVCCK